MSDSIIFSNSDYLAQTTHSTQLARIPEFLIFHGSLCLVMCETWQATGQEVSDKVLFFHLQGDFFDNTPLSQDPLWWQGSLAPESKSQKATKLPLPRPCLLHNYVNGCHLQPAGSHHQRHQIIFLRLALGPFSLFLEVSALILTFPLDNRLTCQKYRNKDSQMRLWSLAYT